ncbi:hypothetical protein D3C76_1590750 [compost metagenome]
MLGREGDLHRQLIADLHTKIRVTSRPQVWNCHPIDMKLLLIQESPLQKGLKQRFNDWIKGALHQAVLNILQRLLPLPSGLDHPT